MASIVKKATIIGGQGFVGSYLVRYLRTEGWQCDVPERNDPFLNKQDMGHVFYCAGLTADFRQRPFATVEAHVQLLAGVLERCNFSSLTYLSSTRVYSGAMSTDEKASLAVKSVEPGDLYNISKLMGESLCLNSGRNVRVVRLSNVYGECMSDTNFLGEILADAVKKKSVIFRSAPDSEKDFVSIQDVAYYLTQIACFGGNEIYNLAAGKNTSNAAIAAILEENGVHCSFLDGAPKISFPEININKLQQNFKSRTQDFASDLSTLFTRYCEAP